MMDLELSSLLKKVADLGGKFTVVDGVPKLFLEIPQNKKALQELQPHLQRLKPKILAHFQLAPLPESTEAEADHPGRHCNLCCAWVYTDSPEIFRLCHMIKCPQLFQGCGFREDRISQLQREEKETKDNERRKQFAIRANQKKRENK